MRVLMLLLICVMSFCQAPAMAVANTSTVAHLSTQSERHSTPVSPKQENREEDDLADEDEDFSDESLISWNYSILPWLNQSTIFFKFYLVGKSNAHILPILTPPDHLR
jgi:hypothetical protein